MIKVCKKCFKEKKLEEFSKNNTTKDGLASWCKPCVRIRSREHYLLNENNLKIKHKSYKDEKKMWFKEFKETLNCSNCGENHPSCLEFHHLDPLKKEFGISDAVGSLMSKESIIEEIEKCIVLCSNCHRKLHWEK